MNGGKMARTQIVSDGQNWTTPFSNKLFETRHRYNAACAAALAAALSGKDAAQLTSEDQVAWRGQAMDWLRADLTFWRNLAKELPSAHPVIQKTLTLWLTDTDLISIRETDSIQMLPVEEREQWESLWKEVRDLLDLVSSADSTAPRESTEQPTGTRSDE